jgi:hypothetical protein
MEMVLMVAAVEVMAAVSDMMWVDVVAGGGGGGGGSCSGGGDADNGNDIDDFVNNG